MSSPLLLLSEGDTAITTTLPTPQAISARGEAQRQYIEEGATQHHNHPSNPHAAGNEDAFGRSFSTINSHQMVAAIAPTTTTTTSAAAASSNSQGHHRHTYHKILTASALSASSSALAHHNNNNTDTSSTTSPDALDHHAAPIMLPFYHPSLNSNSAQARQQQQHLSVPNHHHNNQYNYNHQPSTTNSHHHHHHHHTINTTDHDFIHHNNNTINNNDTNTPFVAAAAPLGVSLQSTSTAPLSLSQSTPSIRQPQVSHQQSYNYHNNNNNNILLYQNGHPYHHTSNVAPRSSMVSQQQQQQQYRQRQRHHRSHTSGGGEEGASSSGLYHTHRLAAMISAHNNRGRLGNAAPSSGGDLSFSMPSSTATASTSLPSNVGSGGGINSGGGVHHLHRLAVAVGGSSVVSATGSGRHLVVGGATRNAADDLHHQQHQNSNQHHHSGGGGSSNAACHPLPTPAKSSSSWRRRWLFIFVLFAMNIVLLMSFSSFKLLVASDGGGGGPPTLGGGPSAASSHHRHNQHYYFEEDSDNGKDSYNSNGNAARGGSASDETNRRDAVVAINNTTATNNATILLTHVVESEGEGEGRQSSASSSSGSSGTQQQNNNHNNNDDAKKAPWELRRERGQQLLEEKLRALRARIHSHPNDEENENNNNNNNLNNSTRGGGGGGGSVAVDAAVDRRRSAEAARDGAAAEVRRRLEQQRLQHLAQRDEMLQRRWRGGGGGGGGAAGHQHQSQQQSPPTIVAAPPNAHQSIGGNRNGGNDGGNAKKKSNANLLPVAGDLPAAEELTPHALGYIKIPGLTDPITVAALVYEEMTRINEQNLIHAEERTCYDHGLVERSGGGGSSSSSSNGNGYGGAHRANNNNNNNNDNNRYPQNINERLQNRQQQQQNIDDESNAILQVRGDSGQHRQMYAGGVPVGAPQLAGRRKNNNHYNGNGGQGGSSARTLLSAGGNTNTNHAKKNNNNNVHYSASSAYPTRNDATLAFPLADIVGYIESDAETDSGISTNTTSAAAATALHSDKVVERLVIDVVYSYVNPAAKSFRKAMRTRRRRAKRREAQKRKERERGSGNNGGHLPQQQHNPSPDVNNQQHHGNDHHRLLGGASFGDLDDDRIPQQHQENSNNNINASADIAYLLAAPLRHQQRRRLLPKDWWTNLQRGDHHGRGVGGISANTAAAATIRRRTHVRTALRRVWSNSAGAMPLLYSELGTTAAYRQGHASAACKAGQRSIAAARYSADSSGSVYVCGVDEWLSRRLNETMDELLDVQYHVVEAANALVELDEMARAVTDAPTTAATTTTTTTSSSSSSTAHSSSAVVSATTTTAGDADNDDENDDDDDDDGTNSKGLMATTTFNGGLVDTEIKDPQRYRDWDELLYSLRGTYYNLMGGPKYGHRLYGGGGGGGTGGSPLSSSGVPAPSPHLSSTVRNIYIVVSNKDQAPPWLTTAASVEEGRNEEEGSATTTTATKSGDGGADDEEAHRAAAEEAFGKDFINRIVLVEHREIVPRHLHPTVLPTFNSYVIESVIHRIPGLARHYIYFNNDMLLARPVSFFDYFQPFVVYPPKTSAAGSSSSLAPPSSAANTSSSSTSPISGAGASSGSRATTNIGSNGVPLADQKLTALINDLGTTAGCGIGDGSNPPSSASPPLLLQTPEVRWLPFVMADHVRSVRCLATNNCPMDRDPLLTNNLRWLGEAFHWGSPAVAYGKPPTSPMLMYSHFPHLIDRDLMGRLMEGQGYDARRRQRLMRSGGVITTAGGIHNTSSSSPLAVLPEAWTEESLPPNPKGVDFIASRVRTMLADPNLDGNGYRNVGRDVFPALIYNHYQVYVRNGGVMSRVNKVIEGNGGKYNAAVMDDFVGERSEDSKVNMTRGYVELGQRKTKRGSRDGDGTSLPPPLVKIGLGRGDEKLSDAFGNATAFEDSHGRVRRSLLSHVIRLAKSLREAKEDGHVDPKAFAKMLQQSARGPRNRNKGIYAPPTASMSDAIANPPPAPIALPTAPSKDYPLPASSIAWPAAARLLILDELIHVMRAVGLQSASAVQLPVRFFGRSPHATTPMSRRFGSGSGSNSSASPSLSFIATLNMSRRLMAQEEAAQHHSGAASSPECLVVGDGGASSRLHSHGNTDAAPLPSMVPAALYLDYRCRSGQRFSAAETLNERQVDDRWARESAEDAQHNENEKEESNSKNTKQQQGRAEAVGAEGGNQRHVLLNAGHDDDGDEDGSCPPATDIIDGEGALASATARVRPSFPRYTTTPFRTANKRGSYDHWLHDWVSMMTGATGSLSSSVKCYFGMMGAPPARSAGGTSSGGRGGIGVQSSTYEDVMPRRGRVLFLTINDDMGAQEVASVVVTAGGASNPLSGGNNGGRSTRRGLTGIASPRLDLENNINSVAGGAEQHRSNIPSDAEKKNMALPPIVPAYEIDHDAINRALGLLHASPAPTRGDPKPTDEEEVVVDNIPPPPQIQKRRRRSGGGDGESAKPILQRGDNNKQQEGVSTPTAANPFLGGASSNGGGSANMASIVAQRPLLLYIALGGTEADGEEENTPPTGSRSNSRGELSGVDDAGGVLLPRAAIASNYIVAVDSLIAAATSENAGTDTDININSDRLPSHVTLAAEVLRYTTLSNLSLHYDRVLHGATLRRLFELEAFGVDGGASSSSSNPTTRLILNAFTRRMMLFMTREMYGGYPELHLADADGTGRNRPAADMAAARAVGRLQSFAAITFAETELVNAKISMRYLRRQIMQKRRVLSRLLLRQQRKKGLAAEEENSDNGVNENENDAKNNNNNNSNSYGASHTNGRVGGGGGGASQQQQQRTVTVMAIAAPKFASQLVDIYQAFSPPYPAPWEAEWKWRENLN